VRYGLFGCHLHITEQLIAWSDIMITHTGFAAQSKSQGSTKAAQDNFHRQQKTALRRFFMQVCGRSSCAPEH